MDSQPTEIKEEKTAHRISYPKRLFTIFETARYLGRGTDSVREMIWTKEFRVVQKGERGKIYLDIKDLDAWIDKNKHFSGEL